MDAPSRAQIARTPHERERLAKEWLMRMIEKTPLADVGELPVSRIAAEAPPLIADILAALVDADVAADRELESEERDRAAKLARLRQGPRAPEQIPRDLAVLQGLLVDAIRRELPDRNPAEFASAVERLAEVFGSIQGAVASSLLEQRGGGGGHDEITGLPGPEQMQEWMRILLAQQRRYEHGFAFALVDIDGLGRINEAYGRPAGDHLVVAVAGVIRRQVRAADQAFRLTEDEFGILCAHQDAGAVVPMAERIASLISGSQLAEGPRIEVAVGIAACPENGEAVEELVESAEAATYAAKAEGRQVATGADAASATVQDR